MLIVRPMTARDLEAVVRLEAATPESPHWSRSVYEKLLGQPDTRKLFVAEESGPEHSQIVGFVVAQAVADICELEFIVVDAAARRTGVGNALFRELVNSATDLGFSRIQLEVRAGNVSAIGFYEHLGFLRDGIRGHYYRNPKEDALLMSVALAPAPK